MVKEAWEGCKVEGWGAFVVKEKLKCVKRVLKNGICFPNKKILESNI